MISHLYGLKPSDMEDLTVAELDLIRADVRARTDAAKKAGR